MADKSRESGKNRARPIRRKAGQGSAADQVAHALREMIFTGVFPAGSLFSEAAVEQHFRGDYSRMPIREAMARLEFEGLLGIEPKVGSRVRRPDTEELAEAFRARIILESEVVRHLAMSPSADWSAALQFLDKIDELLGELANLQDAQSVDASGENPEKAVKAISFAITEADQGFHAALSNAAGYSRTFTPMLARIRDTWRLITVTWDLDYLRQSQEEHRSILAALRQGPEAAIAAMRHHLHRALKRWSIPVYVRDWALKTAHDLLSLESDVSKVHKSPANGITVENAIGTQPPFLLNEDLERELWVWLQKFAAYLQKAESAADKTPDS